MEGQRKIARYTITNVSKKDISKIIKEFEKLTYEGCVQKRPKHQPTESYFDIARQLVQYTMISDAFNLHVEPVRTEITGTQRIPILQVCSLDESKSKGIIVDKTLSQVCSTNESESERVITNESSTVEIKSKSVHKSINIKKLKYAIDET